MVRHQESDPIIDEWSKQSGVFTEEWKSRNDSVLHGGSVAADISAIASCLDTKRAERWKDALALREVVWIFVRASSVCERNRTEEKLTSGRRHIPWKVNEENWHVKPRDDEAFRH